MYLTLTFDCLTNETFVAIFTRQMNMLNIGTSSIIKINRSNLGIVNSNADLKYNDLDR